jgi:hypothetical protein
LVGQVENLTNNALGFAWRDNKLSIFPSFTSMAGAAGGQFFPVGEHDRGTPGVPGHEGVSQLVEFESTYSRAPRSTEVVPLPF